jgi:hypothetical protein
MDKNNSKNLKFLKEFLLKSEKEGKAEEIKNFVLVFDSIKPIQDSRLHKRNKRRGDCE